MKDIPCFIPNPFPDMELFSFRDCEKPFNLAFCLHSVHFGIGCIRLHQQLMGRKANNLAGLRNNTLSAIVTEESRW